MNSNSSNKYIIHGKEKGKNIYSKNTLNIYRVIKYYFLIKFIIKFHRSFSMKFFYWKKWKIFIWILCRYYHCKYKILNVKWNYRMYEHIWIIKRYNLILVMYWYLELFLITLRDTWILNTDIVEREINCN